jgi:Flp pilus assembly pilin Flp
MKNFLNKFRKDESGAMTVEWVVLTAAVVGLAIGAVSLVETASLELLDATSSAIESENDF